MRGKWGLIVVLAMMALSPNSSRAEGSQEKLPALFSIGTGWFEVFKHPRYKDQADIRLEYRSGLSLLSEADDTLSYIDPYFQIHPFGGVETTARGSVYGFGGFVFDFLIGRYLVFSPNFAVGLYSQGGGKRLGAPIEFRSSLEAGVRFPNEMRLTAYCSHISNAEQTKINPGSEMMGGYLHIPLR